MLDSRFILPATFCACVSKDRTVYLLMNRAETEIDAAIYPALSGTT